MADIEFNFGPATDVVAEWIGEEEDRYAKAFDFAWKLGEDVLTFTNLGGSQRAFVRGMGYDDKKAAGVVTMVRRAALVRCQDNQKHIEAYNKKVSAGEASLRGLIDFIDEANKVTPKVKPLTAAQKKVVLAKAKDIKAILAGLDPAVVKAILAEVK